MADWTLECCGRSALDGCDCADRAEYEAAQKAGGHFTAGPWQRKSDYEPTIIIGNVDGEIHPDGSSSYSYDFIANLEDEYGGSPPNAYANAALILAAPELYEALDRLHSAIARNVNTELASLHAVRTLAKARGEQ